MNRVVPLLCAVVWFSLLLGVDLAPAKITPNKSDPATAKANRQAIEAGLLGGGTVKLPAGDITIDQSLRLGPEHSGSTLQGLGPQTILRNAYATGNGVNSTMALAGLGCGYVHNATLTDDGAALIIADTIAGTPLPWTDPSAQANLLVPGNVVYGFIYDSYTNTDPPLPRKRYTVHSFDPKTRRLEFESDKPLPNLLALKWLDGRPIADVHEGDRVVTLTSPAAAGIYLAGGYVFVTDGPSVANSACGEHRRVLSADSTTGVVTLDLPLTRGYAQPALCRLGPVAGVTISRLTIGQPAHPLAPPFMANFVVDLKLDRAQFSQSADVMPPESAFNSCGRITLTDGTAYGQVSWNACHDILIDGGMYAGIYGEEAATTTTIRNAVIRANPKQAAGPPNGIRWHLASDRLRIERTRIEGFGAPHPAGGATSPLSLGGRLTVARDVTIVGSVNTPGLSVSHVAGDGSTLDRVASDLPFWINGGKGWRIDESVAPYWYPRAGSTGTLTATTPTPSPLPPGWTVKP